MKRLAILLLTPISLAVLSGCSVFGIATKGELEAAMEREAAQQRQLEARLAELDRDVAASRDGLTALDSALAANTRQLDEASREWTAMQATLVSHLDSLHAESRLLARDLAALRESMTTVSAEASQAKVQSRQAMRLQYETLLEDRERLMEQLETLDLRLQAWPMPADSAAAQPDAVSAAGPATEPIDLRALAPERPEGGGTLP